MYRLLVLGLLTSFYILSARAEVLYGVVPYQTLGDIKKLFPQAELERAVGPDSRKGAVVLKTAAPDSTGTLYLGFLDSRPGSRESAKKAEILINDAKKVSDQGERKEALGQAKSVFDFFNKNANKSDDEALEIWYVTWVPTKPVPLEKIKKKYGDEDIVVVRDGDTRLYRSWIKFNVDVRLSEDQSQVVFLEASFTPDEKNFYCKRKFDEKLWGKICNH